MTRGNRGQNHQFSGNILLLLCIGDGDRLQTYNTRFQTVPCWLGTIYGNDSLKKVYIFSHTHA